MPNTNHLVGRIYHMVHFDNLMSIFRRQAILSKEKIIKEKTHYNSIAYNTVQNLRDRVLVFDSTKGIFRSVHSYVPFYFALLTPMLYVQYQKGIQNQIVILEVERIILKEPGILFTDGNASNQQLSINSQEIVRIMPATSKYDACRRRYYPNGPHGSNPNCTNFYGDPIFLDRLNWDIINGRYFTGSERTRIKHAEVLVPDSVSIKWISGIAVNSQAMVIAVNNLSARCNLSSRIPLATYKPEMFF